MKTLTEKERRESRRRFLANARRDRHETNALIAAARASQNESELPEYLSSELDSDAWFDRMSDISDLIRDRGRFSNHVSTLAITSKAWETKEAVATWLRRELKRLRDLEKKAGSSPVRRGKLLPRIEIADVAVEMLGCLGGQALTCLFLELLDVDRHRAARAENFSALERASEVEAQLSLQGRSPGVRRMAKLLEVSPSTVTRWRKSKEFQKRVTVSRDIWALALREDYFDELRKEMPAATEEELFRAAFKRYMQSIPARRDGTYR